MTKVSHHLSGLDEQQFLLIHATADGKAQYSLPTGWGGAALGRAGRHSFCSVFPEKIHFQHTAELITQLIKGKANYSLQV